VVFFHGWDKNYVRHLRRFQRHALGWSLSLADAVLVLAKEFQRDLLEFGVRSDVFVETTVVDDGLFDELGQAPLARSSRSSVTLLFLGRVEREKGVFEAVDAYALATKSCASLRLLVAGDGHALEPLRDYIRRLGLEGITLLGHVGGNEKTRVLSEGDIYILPTRHAEGMPITVLEAMAAGMPVITRPVGGIADFFEDGVMGSLLEDCSPATIARHVERLARDRGLRARMGVFNRDYASRRFLASQAARRLEDLYASFLSGPSRRSMPASNATAVGGRSRS
jgi:glycosyltransferase involved in cell wall biosynthesis